jgi:succinoglycan biosynthesis protein ExoM
MVGSDEVESASSSTPTVIVAVCTYRRNDPLRNLLTALQDVARASYGRARVGVVVVDDNPDGRALAVVDDFHDSFEFGCKYFRSGQGNISVARNLAIESAMVESDWVAMIDDDCEPEPNWLCHYLDVLEGTNADCATGPMLLRPVEPAPKWLTEQPFFDDVRHQEADRAVMTVASTNNSIVRSGFLRDHPEIRFKPDLGVLGGEDMVFYRTAHRNGLQIRFAARAHVWGNEPPDRCTFKHQLRYRFWLGNTEFVTNSYLGDSSRSRMVLRGLKRLSNSLIRIAHRVVRREPVQLRYSAASMAGALGLLAGCLGLRKYHPVDEVDS